MVQPRRKWRPRVAGGGSLHPGPDRALLVAAAAFTGACAFGSAVAARHGIAGEPLGVQVPLSVRTGLAVGWGAGVAAPWPMPAAALVAARVSDRNSRLPGLVCGGLGLACIAGTLVEPVTWRRRSRPPTARAAIAGNVVSSAVLAVAGWRSAQRRPTGLRRFAS
jgi:hypothetical protein